MGNSRAGDCGRLTFSRGRSAAPIFLISRLPFRVSAFGESCHAR